MTAKNGHIPFAMLLLSQAPAVDAISWLNHNRNRHFEAKRVAVSDGAAAAAASGKDVVNAASLWPSHIRHACVTRVLLMRVMPRRAHMMPTTARLLLNMAPLVAPLNVTPLSLSGGGGCTDAI
jgi:hypothetical protein